MPQALPVLGLNTLSPADLATCLGVTVRDGVATLTFRVRPAVPDGVYAGVVLGDGVNGAKLYAVAGPVTKDIPGQKPQGCPHTAYQVRYPTKPKRFGRATVTVERHICKGCGDEWYMTYTEGGPHDGMVWRHDTAAQAKAAFERMCYLHTRPRYTKPQVA